MHKSIKEYLKNASNGVKLKGVLMRWAESDIQTFETALKAIWKPGYGLSLGGYAYYPSPKFTRWTASDRSKIKASLPQLIIEYGGKDVMDDFMQMEPENFFDFNGIKKKVDQQGYEGGKLKGNWY